MIIPGLRKWPKLKRSTQLTLELVAMSVVALLLISANPPFRETSDDSWILFQFLEKQQGKQVLGASSHTEADLCPPDKPIIGWIDYAGKKVIRTYLPPGIPASACFTSLEEAYSQGFQKEEEGHQ